MIARMLVPSALPNGIGLSPPEAENKAVEGSYHREVEKLYFPLAKLVTLTPLALSS